MKHPELRGRVTVDKVIDMAKNNQSKVKSIKVKSGDTKVKVKFKDKSKKSR